MARMSDEEFVFNDDVREKKRIARGSHNRRAHAGKGGRVKLSTDYMTKKEIEAMSGEVTTFNLNDPMKWQQFKAMPDDLKIQYIQQLRVEYGVSDAKIAEMLGVCAWTLSQTVTKLGCGRGKSAVPLKFNKDAWNRFIGVEEPKAVEEPEANKEPEAIEKPEKIEVKPERKPERIEGFAIPESGSLTFECNANDALRTIQQLLQNMNVRLHVSWEQLEKGVDMLD